jgi:hypothetical protein
MTERPGTTGPAGPDRVADTLTALRSDVDTIPLADSGAVRRRGEVRTRNQLVGSTLVVVALVAGAIGLGAGLTGGDDKTLVPPANTGTATASQDESSAPDSPATTVTDVPATALMTTDDLAAADVTGLAPVTSGTQLAGIETLNPCLLGSGDIVGGGQAAFGTGKTVRASQMVITQRTVESATNQITAYDADLAGCQDREGAPAGIMVAPPGTTPDQAQLVARLGTDAFVYHLEGGATKVWVLGTRTANAGGYFAFASDTFTLDQALAVTVAAHDRMAATYGD